ncbi:MAG: VCBS repeat-containing protein, partial [Myxococcota bacterium]
MATSACTSGIEIPTESAIRCSTADTQCPDGFVCDVDRERCLPDGSAAPPEPPQADASPVDIGGRFFSSVSWDVVISDINEDAVDLELEVSVGETAPALDSGDWFSPTLAPESATPSALASSVTGTNARIVWDVASDADRITSLETLAVDTDGDASVDETGVTPSATVWLQVTPTDATGLQGETRIVSAVVGNSTATATPVVTWDSQTLRGDITLGFSLADAESDPVDLEVQFRTAPSTPWRSAAIRLGGVSLLAPNGDAPNLVVWASTEEPDDPGQPQGVGNASVEGAEVRARAIDHIAEDVLHFGAWSEPLALPTISNQTPPRLEGLQVLGTLQTERSGPVAISYRAVDEQEDLVDVDFEFSRDNGLTWRRCLPYPSPHHEGRVDLTSSAPIITGFSGMPHIFMWDAGGIGLAGSRDLLLRGFIADDDGPSPLVPVISLSRPLGSLVMREYFEAGPPSWTLGNPGAARESFAADIDGDGRDDVLQVVDGDVSLGGTVVRAYLSGEATAGSVFGAPRITPFGAGPAFAGDFTGDGRIDIGRWNSGLIIYPVGEDGSLGAPNPTVAVDMPTPLFDILAAHIDDDEFIDVVAAGGPTNDLRVSVFWGSAIGFESGPSLPLCAVCTDNENAHLDVGDFNGDGVADLIVSARDNGFFDAQDVVISVLYGQGLRGFDDGVPINDEIFSSDLLNFD